MFKIIAAGAIVLSLVPGAALAGRCDIPASRVTTMWERAMDARHICAAGASAACAKGMAALVCNYNAGTAYLGHMHCGLNPPSIPRHLKEMVKVIADNQDLMRSMIKRGMMKNPVELKGGERARYCRTNGAYFTNW